MGEGYIEWDAAAVAMTRPGLKSHACAGQVREPGLLRIKRFCKEGTPAFEWLDIGLRAL
jgi:hypothetical protein